MKRRLAIGVTGLLLSASLFAYFVWPTVYAAQEDSADIRRVHRWTGDEEFLTSDGWISTADVLKRVEADKVISWTVKTAKGEVGMSLAMRYSEGNVYWTLNGAPASKLAALYKARVPTASTNSFYVHEHGTLYRVDFEDVTRRPTWKDLADIQHGIQELPEDSSAAEDGSVLKRYLYELRLPGGDAVVVRTSRVMPKATLLLWASMMEATNNQKMTEIGLARQRSDPSVSVKSLGLEFTVREAREDYRNRTKPLEQGNIEIKFVERGGAGRDIRVDCWPEVGNKKWEQFMASGQYSVASPLVYAEMSPGQLTSNWLGVTHQRPDRKSQAD